MSSAKEAWISQIRKGVVELAILALLRERERYGVEIVADLSSHPSLAITAGTVYPLLSRMKREGLIDSSWRESPVGPPRKYYRLTGRGGAGLAGMTEAWDGVAASLRELLKAGEA